MVSPTFTSSASADSCGRSASFGPSERFRSANELLERILSVDFHRDLPKEESGSLADVARRIRWHRPLEPLPSVIGDVETYHRSFFPLYMIECLQMLSSNKYMSMGYPTPVKRLSCTTTMCFADVTVRSDVPFSFIMGDIVLLYVGPPGHNLLPGQEIDVRHTEIPALSPDDTPPYVAVPPDHPLYQDTLNHALAYVMSVQRLNCVLRMLVLPPRYMTLETFDMRSVERLEAIQELLGDPSARAGNRRDMAGYDMDKGVWYVSKLCSFATSMREFRALCRMESMPLAKMLLRQYDGPPLDTLEAASDKHACLQGIRIPRKLRESLEASFNVAQLRAIRNSLKSEGITLIQGPPGTGKTTTIIGLISAILEHESLPSFVDGGSGSEEKKGPHVETGTRTPWMMSTFAGQEPLDVTFDELNATGTHDDGAAHRYDSYACMVQEKATSPETVTVPILRHRNRRILICAPSNAAIDEIVRRLVRPVTGGIFNHEGERYNPTVTRIGPNFHDDLSAFSLNNKVERLILLKYGTTFTKVSKHTRELLATKTLRDSDIVCSTLSACGSNELFAHRRMFDTLIVDEATQAVELSTLIALCIGCRRVILVGDPCQLSATVCSNVAVSLNYDRSLFQRLQICGYPVNLLNIQYRMDPLISRFPSMYFYKNQLKDAPAVYQRPQDDWREFPLLRPTVFYAIDSMQTKNETSYMNEMEAEIVCQLIDIILEVLSAEPEFRLSSLEQRVAVITTYSAQVVLLKETIARRHPQLVLPPAEKEEPKAPGPKVPKLLIDVSSVDGFQGMEKEIVIFSAVRTSYMSGRKVVKKSLQELTPAHVLTIDGEPHEPEAAKRFARISEDYFEGIKTGQIVSDIQDVADVSFIADRRRINVAITRACRNLFIIGNPRFLLGHKHWYSLYMHYAQCGCIFLCKTERSHIKAGYLKEWAREYLQKNKVGSRSEAVHEEPVAAPVCGPADGMSSRRRAEPGARMQFNWVGAREMAPRKLVRAAMGGTPQPPLWPRKDRPPPHRPRPTNFNGALSGSAALSSSVHCSCGQRRFLNRCVTALDSVSADYCELHHGELAGAPVGLGGRDVREWQRALLARGEAQLRVEGGALPVGEGEDLEDARVGGLLHGVVEQALRNVDASILGEDGECQHDQGQGLRFGAARALPEPLLVCYVPLVFDDVAEHQADGVVVGVELVVERVDQQQPRLAQRVDGHVVNVAGALGEGVVALGLGLPCLLLVRRLKLELLGELQRDRLEGRHGVAEELRYESVPQKAGGPRCCGSGD
ncbi:tRNA-splicing endonuclease [Babesia caballi]|uniref:tRNA-splicing endonuclease n=1 Tax=Babesia caballi TaxID=5871 RepID=A0AAV4LNX0_BABCB|nr:tRNA-splicing endonuclease [Babesia caballi]